MNLTPTRREKEEIRRYYSDHARVVFRSDGQVWAQRRVGDTPGVLYTPAQLKEHVFLIRERRGA